MESKQQTGVIYDEEMAEHKCLWDLNYNEKPERFIKILERYVKCTAIFCSQFWNGWHSCHIFFLAIMLDVVNYIFWKDVYKLVRGNPQNQNC